MNDKQTKRYSDKELSLIENTFKDQEALMILIRRFLLQDELTEDEMSYLKQYTDNKAVFDILKKTIDPDLDKRAPMHQTVDLFSGMDLQPTELNHAILHIKARHKVHKFLSQRFDALQGKKVADPIIFDKLVDPEGKDRDEAYSDFIARNFLLGYIDSQGLKQLLILAALNETPEQTAEKLRANSSK